MSQLANVVFGVPGVSDSINNGPGEVFFKRLGNTFYDTPEVQKHLFMC